MTAPEAVNVQIRRGETFESAGLSRAKLAKITRLSEATIKLIESGHAPSSRTRAVLAKVPGFASLLETSAELRVRMPDPDTAQLLRRIAPLLGMERDADGALILSSVRQFVLLAVLALFTPELLAEVSPATKGPTGR